MFLKFMPYPNMEEYLSNAIADLMLRAETDLPNDVKNALKKAAISEKGIAKLQLMNILKNIELSKNELRPMCQDTGTPTFFIKVGADFPYRKIIKDAIINGVRKATDKIPLRPNAVDILTGKNSGDNIGKHVPFIHWKIVEGNECIITAMPKGGGSENVSALKMMNPGEGIEGAKKFVLLSVINAGGKPCPPTVVGVGIGGGADIAMELAKEALLRKVGDRNENEEIALMEEELLEEINSTGIGPMGLGGKTTSLDVHIEIAHRHPASFPVAVAMQCWANRRKTIKIDEGGRIWNID